MLEKLHQKMLGVASMHHLPKSFESDLDDDLLILKAFEGKRFIWLLRTSGSTLVPLGMGADPAHITHWLFSNHGQRILAFLVDSGHCTVEKLSFEQAEKLIHQPPLIISAFVSHEDTINKVSQVLQNGISQGIWGVFGTPNIGVCEWEKWQSYFKSSGNTLMHSFMKKAIRMLNLRLLRQAS